MGKKLLERLPSTVSKRVGRGVMGTPPARGAVLLDHCVLRTSLSA
ncbi:hypothetical protein [Burkholderia ambifaria]|nr:hypothetical protein [Burkholderia ambifaria]